MKNNQKFLIVFTVGFLAYASIYIARLNFAVASPAFEAEGILTKVQIGIIGSIFSFTYALCKVPGGILGDRFPTCNIIMLGLVLTGISNLIIGIVPSFMCISAAWGLNALGQSMLWGPLLRTMHEICSDDQYKAVSRSLGISIAVGSIAGLITASFLLSRFGVKACFLLPAFICFIMAGVVRMFFTNVPGHMGKSAMDMINSVRGITGQAEFRSMFIPAMGHGMIKDNINVWLAIYFVDTYGLDIKAVGGYIFFVPLMSFLGKILYPMLYAWLKDDYRISIYSFVLCVAASMYLASGLAGTVTAVFCLGLLAALVAAINTHILAVFPGKISDASNMSFAASVMDLLVYGGAGIGSLIFGRSIQNFGYKSMFVIWAAVSFISAIIMIYNKRRYSTTDCKT